MKDNYVVVLFLCGLKLRTPILRSAHSGQTQSTRHPNDPGQTPKRCLYNPYKNPRAVSTRFGENMWIIDPFLIRPAELHLTGHGRCSVGAPMLAGEDYQKRHSGKEPRHHGVARNQKLAGWLAGCCGALVGGGPLLGGRCPRKNRRSFGERRAQRLGGSGV